MKNYTFDIIMKQRMIIFHSCDSTDLVKDEIFYSTWLRLVENIKIYVASHS